MVCMTPCVKTVHPITSYHGYGGIIKIRLSIEECSMIIVYGRGFTLLRKMGIAFEPFNFILCFQGADGIEIHITLCHMPIYRILAPLESSKGYIENRNVM